MTNCIKQIRIGFPALRKGNLQKTMYVLQVDEEKSPSRCYEKLLRPALEDMLLFDLKARVSRESLVRYESVQALGSLRDCTIAVKVWFRLRLWAGSRSRNIKKIRPWREREHVRESRCTLYLLAVSKAMSVTSLLWFRSG